MCSSGCTKKWLLGRRRRSLRRWMEDWLIHWSKDDQGKANLARGSDERGLFGPWPRCLGIYIPADEVLAGPKYQWFAHLSSEDVLKTSAVVVKYFKSSAVNAETTVVQSVATLYIFAFKMRKGGPPFSLITAHKVGVLNEKRCNPAFHFPLPGLFCFPTTILSFFTNWLHRYESSIIHGYLKKYIITFIIMLDQIFITEIPNNFWYDRNKAKFRIRLNWNFSIFFKK